MTTSIPVPSLLDDSQVHADSVLPDFPTILRDHGSYLHAVCRRLTGSSEDSEDVFQDTLVAIHRNLHSFRGEASLRTWLFAVARSQAHRWRRRDSRQRAGAASEFLDLGADRGSRGHGDDFVRQDLQWSLNDSLLHLSEVDRRVLWMRDFEGRSAEETAAELGLSVPAVKSRLLRSRRQMRAMLSKAEELRVGQALPARVA